MTIIEAIRGFLLTCPLLDGETLRVDFLPPEATSYSVDVVPTDPIVRRYLDGKTIRQFLFLVATRTYFGPTYRQQIDNLAFFESLANWIEEQSKHRNLPSLGEGKAPIKIEVVSSGYVFSPDMDTARYQMQCRLSYMQKGER